jgi:acylphosphatase
MNKCLRITFSASVPEGFLHDFIQKNAKKLNLEGVVQMVPVENKIRVIVCGHKDQVDAFVDILHKGKGKTLLEQIEIEPFLKDKDYRGVFRVIE